MEQNEFDDYPNHGDIALGIALCFVALVLLTAFVGIMTWFFMLERA